MSKRKHYDWLWHEENWDSLNRLGPSAHKFLHRSVSVGDTEAGIKGRLGDWSAHRSFKAYATVLVSKVWTIFFSSEHGKVGVNFQSVCFFPIQCESDQVLHRSAHFTVCVFVVKECECGHSLCLLISTMSSDVARG